MRVLLEVTAGPHQGRTFAFDHHDNFIIGRAPHAHFRLPKMDPYFSRTHFLIEVNPPFCRLIDMGSTNGTFVNGRRTSAATLRDGDVIQGGDTEMRVSIAGGTAPTADANTPDDRTVVPCGWRREAAREGESPTHRPSLPTTEDLRIHDSGESDPHTAQDAVPEAVSGSDRSAALLPADYRERIRRRPQPVPDYAIVDEIGRGGMGVVYLAVRSMDEAVVALKLITPGASGSANELRRFVREAEILQSLRHPQIVRFIEMGAADGMLYIAMEYVPGIDAHKLVRRSGGALPIARAVAIACQLLDALDFAHRSGFVHRDIKPGNVLIRDTSGQDVAMLADFGLARAYQASRLSGLTMTGELRGTAPYMPPEQITHFRDVKPATDQYSAAAALYHLLTGKHVYDFPRDTAQQLLMILQNDPVPILERRNDIPEELAAIIHRALLRQPDRRFPSAGELRDALARFAH